MKDSNNSRPFVLDADTPWGVAPDQPEPMDRALEGVFLVWADDGTGIVNDTRPVLSTVDIETRFAWDAESVLARDERSAGDAALADWSRRQLGEEVAEAAAAYTRTY